MSCKSSPECFSEAEPCVEINDGGLRRTVNASFLSFTVYMGIKADLPHTMLLGFVDLLKVLYTV